MQEAESIARNKGFEKMNLSVSKENRRAIAFYEKLGWERVIEGGEWKGRFTKSLLD